MTSMINECDKKRLLNGLNQPSGSKWISTDYLYSDDPLELDPYEFDFITQELGYTQLKERTLPSGSTLFSHIIHHADYYPGGVEARMLVNEATPQLSVDDVITEFGPGDGSKTRAVFMQNLHRSGLTYQAIDSSSHSLDMTAGMLHDFPNLQVTQLLSDSFFCVNKTFTRADKVLFFGSTISNFSINEATSLLHHIRTEYLREGGYLYLGQDGNQDVESLYRCYHNSDSSFAALCLGVLLRVRRYYMSNIDLRRFYYHFEFNEESQLVQLGFKCKSDHTAQFLGTPIHFQRDEWVRTAFSYKHSRSSMAKIASLSGFTIEETISSPEGINVHRLRA